MRDRERGRKERETLAALFPNEFLVSLQIECLKLRLALQTSLQRRSTAPHTRIKVHFWSQLPIWATPTHLPLPNPIPTKSQPNLRTRHANKHGHKTRHETRCEAARNLLKTIESVQSWQAAEIFTAWLRQKSSSLEVVKVDKLDNWRNSENLQNG